MNKTYISKADVHINVKLPSGSRKHVTFVQLTGGGSKLATSDADLQAALEAHPWFGRVYRLATEEEAPKAQAPKPAKGAKEPGSGTATALKRVAMTDREKAKDYLADNFGELRTNMRSLEKLTAAAARHGIEFDFGDGAAKASPSVAEAETPTE